ncbi:MAG: ribulose phosphate epimerase [Candidatus Rokuibacteriota bacterium]|nr:MAG: ribulose phosphate epimerase [Candidatus Rokubacteria bacterium]
MKPPITWPSGTTSAVSITFDLDAETAWISRDAANINRLSVMSQGAYGPKVGVPLILDFLDRNRLTSTFFVPGWTAERWPDVVAEIHRRGHEIGHHGYLHEALEGKSREEEELILTGSSRILADITGTRPVGYRAPLYEITPETTSLLAKHGFLYASNLQDSLWPYRHPEAPSLVELPASWILDDGPFFAFGLRPNLYRQIFPPAQVLSVWRDEFRGIRAVGGLTMLILHPQYTGRPSRLNMLQELVDEMRDTEGVWFVNGVELARYALTAAANTGTDGRPRA